MLEVAKKDMLCNWCQVANRSIHFQDDSVLVFCVVLMSNWDNIDKIYYKQIAIAILWKNTVLNFLYLSKYKNTFYIYRCCKDFFKLQQLLL